MADRLTGSAGAIIADFILTRLAIGAPMRTVGLCGPQGSGKSTASEEAASALSRAGVSVGLISLDDFYFGRGERQRLAEVVHPLLATRGPPGTHDVARLQSVLDALARGEKIRLLRFDKATDDIAGETYTAEIGPVDVVILEGWCVGAAAQPESDLAVPLNRLETVRDPDGTWRRYVNHQLKGPYHRLFATIDDLILLRAPDFSVVKQWRLEQETTNLRGLVTGNAMGGMPVEDFIHHYERVTTFAAKEMPTRADLVLQLDMERRIDMVSLRKYI